jgi:hypothetical protein
MKEFFVNGVHGFNWKPHDVDSACEAMHMAIQTGREVLSANCRATALQHSWNNAATQIERVYVDLTAKRATRKPTVFSYVKQKLYGVAILAKWVYLMLLVCTVMLPFMKVFKPTKELEIMMKNSEAETVPSCMRKKTNTANGRKRGSLSKRSKRSSRDTSSTDSSREASKDRSVNGRRRRTTKNSTNKTESGLMRYLRRRVESVRASFVSFSTHVATLVISVMSITVMCAICLNINSLLVNSSAVATE